MLWSRQVNCNDKSFPRLSVNMSSWHQAVSKYLFAVHMFFSRFFLFPKILYIFVFIPIDLIWKSQWIKPGASAHCLLFLTSIVVFPRFLRCLTLKMCSSIWAKLIGNTIFFTNLLKRRSLISLLQHSQFVFHLMPSNQRISSGSLLLRIWHTSCPCECRSFFDKLNGQTLISRNVIR